MTNEHLAEIEARARADQMCGYNEIAALIAEVRRLKAEIERLRGYRVDAAPLCDECGVRHYPGANTLCRKTPV